MRPGAAGAAAGFGALLRGRVMRSTVFVNADLCTGCKLCELVCADAHEGLTGPAFSRIRVESFPRVNAWFPVVCAHCAKPPCVAACPSRARSKDHGGLVAIDAESCIGCGQCVLACPLGAASMHPDDGFAIGCDLCSGSPACVEACASKALRFVPGVLGARGRRRNWALKNLARR